jgi:hypothetical protein
VKFEDGLFGDNTVDCQEPTKRENETMSYNNDGDDERLEGILTLRG